MDSLSPKSSRRKYPQVTPGYIFIYGLVDPRKPEKIRYIGKTDDLRKRLNGHIHESRSGNGKRLVENWIKRLLRAGVRPEMIVLDQVPIEKWEEAEIYWIALYRFRYADLLNVAEGGGPISPECYSRGMNRPGAKLNDELVLEMRVLRSQGVSITELAEKYGVDTSIVVRTCHGETWKHIGGPLTRYPYVEPKLTDEQVVEMRILRSQGITDRVIAERFGIDESGVSLICRGKTYKDAGGPIAQSHHIVPNVNEEMVVEMRTLRAQGMTTAIIAEQFGLDQSSVSRICEGKTWKDAGGPVTIGARYGLPGQKGDNHTSAKITGEQARQMREMYATSEYTYEQLAQLFGLGVRSVAQVLSFKTWKEAGGPKTIGTHRGFRGEKSPAAKLTREQVEQIREMYATGSYSQTQLARMFDLDPSTVCDIVNFKKWKSIGGPLATDINHRKPFQKGEEHPNTKLTKEQVAQIREMYASGCYSQTQLGQLFDVKPGTIWGIVHYKRWN